MKKVLKVMAWICGILFLCALFFFKIEEISECIIAFKANVFSHIWDSKESGGYNTEVDFSQYTPFRDTAEDWFAPNRLIAHACGGIDGKTYTNSREALELAIEHEHRVIEIDLAMTWDKKIVLQHSWGGPPSYQEYMDTPILYLYEAMDIFDIFAVMKEYPDLYFVTDIKGEAEERKEIIEQVVENARSEGYEDVLDRFIIQIYEDADYDAIKNIYPFSNWIYTLYVSGERDFNRIAEFCLINNIPVVTMPTGWIDLGENIQVFETMNIKVYTHTTNDLDYVLSQNEQGVYGFYTDFIKPDDLHKIDFSW